MTKTEESLRDIWENIKCTNTHIIGVPEGYKREKGPQKIFEEIKAKNFPNMGKEMLNQGAQRIPYKKAPEEKQQDTY